MDAHARDGIEKAKQVAIPSTLLTFVAEDVSPHPPKDASIRTGGNGDPVFLRTRM